MLTTTIPADIQLISNTELLQSIFDLTGYVEETSSLRAIQLSQTDLGSLSFSVAIFKSLK